MLNEEGVREQHCFTCRHADDLGSSYRPPSSQHLSPGGFASSQNQPQPRVGPGHANPDAAERERRSWRATMKEPDPPLDLSSENWRDDPALSDRDYTLLNNFREQLDKEKMETCARCDEKWFHMGLNDDRVCTSCINADKELDEDMPFLYSGANDMDPGPAAAGLEPLTQIQEMLIARVHCFVEVRQVRGVQYKYKGHVVNFLTNTPKDYNRLPLLPEDLDVILIRLVNWNKDPRMRR
ncbi:hypothetical protein P3342_000008 [Pyrenophora teres f. teres]|nr:hypothetical protein P3342_000008 [Pyrenophora teres f. teres]